MSRNDRCARPGMLEACTAIVVDRHIERERFFRRAYRRKAKLTVWSASVDGLSVAGSGCVMYAQMPG